MKEERYRLMTISEIELEFQNEWVLVEDPEFDVSDRFGGGKVRCHSRSRDDIYRKAIELRLKDSAILRTGPTSKLFFIKL